MTSKFRLGEKISETPASRRRGARVSISERGGGGTRVRAENIERKRIKKETNSYENNLKTVRATEVGKRVAQCRLSLDSRKNIETFL